MIRSAHCQHYVSLLSLYAYTKSTCMYAQFKLMMFFLSLLLLLLLLQCLKGLERCMYVYITHLDVFMYGIFTNTDSHRERMKHARLSHLSLVWGTLFNLILIGSSFISLILVLVSNKTYMTP